MKIIYNDIKINFERLLFSEDAAEDTQSTTPSYYSSETMEEVDKFHCDQSEELENWVSQKQKCTNILLILC